MSKLHKNTPPISSDVQPPVQLTPTDLQLALRQACLLDYFKSLSPSHRREYIQWLESAKKPETRAARITKTLTMLSSKSK